MEELDIEDKEEDKVEKIRKNKIYMRESESGHLLGLHYLVSWKRYPKEENN